MTKQYRVIIVQNDDYAILECDTLKEALELKRSFVNYGKCQKITIENILEYSI